ncbi:MAG: proline iminopeptidase-family hydrolase [bacterium]|jgi:proline iminopeptidase
MKFFTSFIFMPASRIFICLALAIILAGCQAPGKENTGSIQEESKSSSHYFDPSGRGDLLTGGVRMIPIETASGTFKVWTKRVGNNPDIKLLLLHGGPGATHEYFECFDSFLPAEGIEYYYYDQLESEYSDQPGDTSLWNIEHFVEEVEQVRLALGLDSTNFFLLGHSWGGILAIEYAMKYQHNLKGLVISNMMSSIPDYIKYANDVLGPGLEPGVLKQVREMEAAKDFLNPLYLELVSEYYYPKHILRMPAEEWPEPVVRSFGHLNYPFYVAMQGPSEFGVVGDARLKNWDRSKDLGIIKTPVLTIGAEFDTMDPEHMAWMATQFPKGRNLYCPNGSHMAMYDDQETYISGLVQFIMDVDAETHH